MYLHNLYCYLWYTWLHMFLFIERHKNHAVEGLLGRPPSKPLQPLFLWRYFPRRWILSPLQLFSWKASLFNNISLRAVVLKLWPRTSSKGLLRELARSAVSGALCRPVGSGGAVEPGAFRRDSSSSPVQCSGALSRLPISWCWRFSPALPSPPPFQVWKSRQPREAGLSLLGGHLGRLWVYLCSLHPPPQVPLPQKVTSFGDVIIAAITGQEEVILEQGVSLI